MPSSQTDTCVTRNEPNAQSINADDDDDDENNVNNKKKGKEEEAYTTDARIASFIRGTPQRFQNYVAVFQAHEGVLTLERQYDRLVYEAVIQARAHANDSSLLSIANPAILGPKRISAHVRMPMYTRAKLRAELQRSLFNENENENENENMLDEKTDAIAFVPFVVTSTTASAANNANNAKTNEDACKQQRESLTLCFTKRITGTATRITVPVSTQMFAGVREHINKYAYYHYFYMPLLVFGCRTPVFNVMLTKEPKRYFTDTLNCAHDAMTAIAMYPIIRARQHKGAKKVDTANENENENENEVEDDAKYEAYTKGFEKKLAELRTYWWFYLRDEFFTGECSTQVFNVKKKEFFNALVGMTLDYVQTCWTFAMDMYGFTNEHDSQRYIGFEKNPTEQCNFTDSEAAFMVEAHAECMAWRMEQHALDAPSTQEIHNAKELLADTFQGLYQRGKKQQKTPDAVYVSLEENPYHFLNHVRSTCSCRLERTVALPQSMTIGDLYVLWQQCRLCSSLATAATNTNTNNDDTMMNIDILGLRTPIQEENDKNGEDETKNVIT